jgi:F-type H+-transporting ATPase subunit b
MLLEINPGLILWTIITFVILVLLLRMVAWKPILSALNAREETIRDSLRQADLARAEAEKLQKKNRDMLLQIEREAQLRMKQAREQAEAEKEKMLESARQEIQRELNAAHQEIQMEKEQALAQLRNQVADLAVDAAGKIIDFVLDEKKQKKLVDDFILQLPSEKN